MFDVVGPLAIGAGAEVLLAHARGEPGRRIVLKSLDARARPRGLRLEGALGAQLAHPHLRRSFGAVRLGDDAYVALEWVDGVTLDALIARGRTRGGLPWRPVVEIAAAIAGALHALHTARDAAGRPRPVVHSDVCPCNIMISFDGLPKLLDLGLAVVGGAPCPERGRGTLGYMAPEQWRGERPDPRTDVRALGVCLWEALRGDRLHRSTDPRAVMEATLRRPPPPVGRPDLPERLEEIVARATARAREDRFATADHFARALRALLPPASGRELARLVRALFAAERLAGPRLVRPSPR